MKVKSITTELMVDNMAETIGFYVDLLGFTVVAAEPEKNPFFVILKKGDVELMLYQRKQFSEEIPKFSNMDTGGTISLYIGVESISLWYTTLKDKVTIIQDMHRTNYGTIEFSFEDNNGYVLMLAERV